MKKIFEKLRYLEQYKFDYLMHMFAAITGIILVLINPDIYLLFSVISLVMHTFKVIKIGIDNKKGEGNE
jgi:hypothetical protein